MSVSSAAACCAWAGAAGKVKHSAVTNAMTMGRTRRISSIGVSLGLELLGG